jgi:general secretion pathway protein D
VGVSNASIVAKPSVTASFGKPAIFRSGVEVPIQVSVDPETGTKVFEYRQTGLTLEFVAVPVGVHLIRLDISANMSTVDDTTTENPRFDTRSVSTTVDLRRGDTVLLSGLDELEISSSQSSDFGLPSSSRSKVNRSVGLFVTIE